VTTTPAPTVHLRDYQVASVEAIKRELVAGNRTLLVSPTGAGKTIVCGTVLRDFKRKTGTLTIVHRDELVTQTIEKLGFLGVARDDIGVVKAERNELGKRHTIASIQTIWRENRLEQLMRFNYGLIWIDEAHHAPAATYQLVLQALRADQPDGPLLFGCTATSDRMDGQGLGKSDGTGTFQSIAFQIKMLSLIKQGYLTDLKALRVTMPINLAEVRKSDGDFTDKSLGEAMIEANAHRYIAEGMAEHARGRRSAIFTPIVDVAVATMGAVREQGFSCELVIGETPPDERRRIYRALADGKLDAISSVGVLTEGWDEPSVDCIVMARPTQSRALYQQIIGRGLRPYPDKEHCLVLDMVGNSDHKRLETAASLIGRELEEEVGHAVDISDEDLTGELGMLGDLEMLLKEEKKRKTRVLVGQEAEAREVDMLARAPLKWAKPESGVFMIDLGKNETTLQPQGWVLVERTGATYRALRLHPHINFAGFVDSYGVEILGEGLDHGYALGVAGDIARDLKPPYLLDAKARWRKRDDAPSERQVELLTKFKLPPAATKREASDALDNEFARRALRRVTRPPVREVAPQE